MLQLSAACVLAVACACGGGALPGGSSPSVAGQPAVAGASGAQPSAAGAAGGGGKLSFANDVYPKLIRTKCGACHNDAPSFGGLAFFPGGPETAYMNLVNQPAGNSRPDFKCKDSGLIRVVPGDPEHSLMYLKLTNPPCGSKMPSGIAGMATPEQLELVRQWILDGAAP